MFLVTTLTVLAALLIEAAVGYPDGIYRRAGHPVTWIGAVIARLDAALNRGSPLRRRIAGVVALAAILALAVGAGVALAALAALAPPGAAALLLALPASTLLAQRSLHGHVAAVAAALEGGSLAAGRSAVGHIVGRDTAVLDEAGVCRAAIESLAENFSDGIVAPAFWLALGGLPAGLAYKACNTADSMIGHRTPRHADFGWAAARFDDAINLPASRGSGVLLVCAAALVPDASPRWAWTAMLADAPHHRSPNAGWPEAAMAGALGLSLAGPRRYAGVMVDDREMGRGGRRAATPADIRRALRLYRAADALLIVLAALAAAAAWLGHAAVQPVALAARF